MTAKSSQQQDAAQAITQPATHEQLLALLGEINDKLLPLSAPKPETVAPIDVQGFLPLQEARSALADALESLERACNTIQAEADALIRKQSSARNERAWHVVFSQSRRDMRDMVGAVCVTGNNLRSFANQLAACWCWPVTECPLTWTRCREAKAMSNTGYASLDHVGAITLAQSIMTMALGAGEFLVADSDTVEGKAATGSFNLIHYAAVALLDYLNDISETGIPPQK